MGKAKYISKLEAEWLINLIEYHDAPISDEGMKAKESLREKARDVLYDTSQ